MEEIMYISEISLYIGRKLSNDEKDLSSSDKAIYGTVPPEVLGNYMEAVERLKSKPEFRKELEVSEKAFKQFLKTRKKVSRSCKETSKNLDLSGFNPLFKEKIGGLNENDLKKKEELIKEIKNYKPRAAYLELHKIRKNEDQRDNEQFFKIIDKMKNIEKKAHSKMERMKLEEEGDLDKSDDDKEERKISEEEEKKQNMNPLIRLNKKRMKSLTDKTFEKKVKTTDFKHPTQYIAYDRSKNKVISS